MLERECLRMDYAVRPEPSPEEREALERALRRLLAEHSDARSDWWRAGVRESLEPDEDDATGTR
jgi:hypothetical protein